MHSHLPDQKDSKNQELKTTQKLIKTFELNKDIVNVIQSSDGSFVLREYEFLYVYNPTLDELKGPFETSTVDVFAFPLPNGKILLNEQIFDPLTCTFSDSKSDYPYRFAGDEDYPYALDSEHIMVRRYSYADSSLKTKIDFINVNSQQRKSVDLKNETDGEDLHLHQLRVLSDNRIAALFTEAGLRNQKIRVYRYSNDFTLTKLNEKSLNDCHLVSVLPNNYFTTMSRSDDFPNCTLHVWNPDTLTHVSIKRFPYKILYSHLQTLLADGLTMVFPKYSLGDDNGRKKFLSFNLDSLELSPFSAYEITPPIPNLDLSLNIDLVTLFPTATGQFFLFQKQGCLDAALSTKYISTLSLITVDHIENLRQEFFNRLTKILDDIFPKVLTSIIKSYVPNDDLFAANLTKNPNGFFAKYGANVADQEIQVANYIKEFAAK